MLGEDLDAASAGYRVGYGDASHFNREYKRLFGAGAPRRRNTMGRARRVGEARLHIAPPEERLCFAPALFTEVPRRGILGSSQ
jgi:Mrp family chromosome partitioning ATPase